MAFGIVLVASAVLMFVVVLGVVLGWFKGKVNKP